MPDESHELGMNPADAVNVDAVKQTRKSMTRGPIAVTLLFLAGVAGLVGIGGFWALPIYQETQQLHDELSNLTVDHGKLRVELAEAQKRNLEAEPTDVEKTIAKRIPQTVDYPQLIRDVVQLIAMDASTPDDDIQVRSFTLEQPKATKDGYSSVGATLTYSGPASSVQELLQTISTVREGEPPRRIATPRSISIAYASTENVGGTQGSASSARFAYLLRQERRHLISDAESKELERAKRTRVQRYQEARRTREELQQRLRELEGQSFTGGAELLALNNQLATVRAELKAQNDLVTSLGKEAAIATAEVSGSLKLDFFAETGGSPAPGSAAAAPPPPAK